ncbi:protein MpC2H2-12 [Marchantia polymorpha subsp. ruderalis]|uniref:BED-type domain-containing protein n=2 Tax=Marchantia polymorpha TaxID=3197 RepID=A0AAF6B9N5_MARPO|nr:hypothetical protein MARPO_0070s0095 [Marchantia polymorpha]BBN08716.1 hypothetical protein Mp_4g13860 [Marchantia polymorpha subsp. ruderalis]PTQ35636.1 hypothetical protein MARPO_0070s0095 [Marchantia polymorpha]PTQ35637.1 hypothetical protein MARPO_0070s0095 [Marchantia polymorpha]PTQ35638.1 hypothetical protein MARPO_0070s0095 [Marchantia polymorpha]|eukprot:PTQ35635.1 hypothetical protein MARPO_0070s0095 [Marchantia polymorpha]
MGKKKKKSFKVWCFYCEREFEDEKILIQHQKAKHFKCHVCHKKLSTAGGMVVHVLQVHKESITKVPNAKPERESTEPEIFGMEGIPPEILAAHDGDQGGLDDDEKPAKVARVEIPPSSPFGGLVMGPIALGMASQPMYSPMPPVYMSQQPSGPRPPSWPPQPPNSHGWNHMHPGQPPMHPPRPPPPPQPLFPIQAPNPPSMSSASALPPAQPLFPIRPAAPPSSAPPSQPLFPVNGTPSTGSSSSSSSVGTSSSGVPLRSPGNGQTAVDSTSGAGSLPGGQSSVTSATMVGRPPSLPFGGVPNLPPSGSHMYASAPSTGGPSIGPPPVISNKPPGPPGLTNEVYLVWDDEILSMEERRLSLPQYQVLDETSQMNTIEAAFDRRILEGRLAGRMGFRV